MILAIALAATLYNIAWLAGDWQLTSGARCVEEHWTSPSANMLVGTSRTVEAGRTFTPPGDTRELGVVFGVFEIR